MTTNTIQRELKRIMLKHREIGNDLERILASTEAPSDRPYYDSDELSPEASKRIKRAEKEFAEGKGIVLKNSTEIHKFFREMRHG